ncbi:MAG: hypothetical protein CMJ58_04275 [Planctomycetaceae bacterium]|nr:hypothetical protein [Planctomycetaceae bacterium]
MIAAVVGVTACNAGAEEGSSPFRTLSRSKKQRTVRRVYVNPYRIVLGNRFTSNPFGLPAVTLDAGVALADSATSTPTVVAAPAASDTAAVAVAAAATATSTATSSVQPSAPSTASSVIIAPPPYRPPPRSPFRPPPRPPF